MKIKQIAIPIALAACLSGIMAVNANASSTHFVTNSYYGLSTGYTVGSVGSTSLNGPSIVGSYIIDFAKNWRGQYNIGGAFLNGAGSNNAQGIPSSSFLGEMSLQVGYKVYPKLYTYGLLGVAGIGSSSFNSNNNSSSLEGFSYDMYKYMSVYAQYTGQAFSSTSTGSSAATGAFFTAGLEFHTGLF